ncbi:hypothetical protein SCLCIDRAFT_9515 [Scleroderma citrinum Foug A]|uniref:Uncharacterized protein n=1 Tax=Scleroderma citrinum Foug A TaxID=1036808 RepID=A0A0C3DKH1_9AGAM|nr:hypothetical protein SCLCIDRAFT_9515 [Scleroderma citrinum Foug A]
MPPRYLKTNSQSFAEGLELCQRPDCMTYGLQLQNEECVAGEFNHPAIKMIIIRTIWSPPGKFLDCITITETMTIDPLIAFAATMARWALNNLLLGRELDFDAAFNGCFYDQAVKRIERIWNEGGIQLYHLELLTADILCHTQKLIHHYIPEDIA